MGKVAVLGSINVDLVFTSKVRPKAGETVLGENFSIIPGGKGANQAVAAAKLGSQAYMIGCVGNDSNGEFSVKNFQHMNVSTERIEVLSDIPTGVANIIVAENDNSIIVIGGANLKVTKELVDKSKDILLSSDIVLMQLEIPVEVVEYAAELCSRNNVRVLLNPAPAIELSQNLINNSTYITPNEHELKVIFGEGNDTDEILKNFPNKVIVTMGSKGVKYFNGSELKVIRSYKTEVVDTTGAGDTFCGAFAAALVSGKNLQEAIEFANKAAAISITKLGAQSGMPTLEEMQNFK